MPSNCGASTPRLLSKRLRVTHNNAYRILRYIPRNISFRPHQVTHFIRTFDVTVINTLHAFTQRCVYSSNFFIRSLQFSVAFYKPPFFSHYVTLVHENDRMQLPSAVLFVSIT